MKKILNDLGLTTLLRILTFRSFDINIFNKQFSKLLIDVYDGYWGHSVSRKNGDLGFGFFHFGLIAAHKPKRVLCVGSQKGFIPVICALACKSNNKGHVDFVDAGFDEGHPKAWSGIGFWRKVNLNKHFAKAGAENWITTHVLTTEDFAKKNKRRYDYIYIDGDHSYEGVKRDYKIFWPLLNKGGFMAFHDVLAEGSFRSKYNFGVWKLWKEIKNEKIYFSRLPGLGILQK